LRYLHCFLRVPSRWEQAATRRDTMTELVEAIYNLSASVCVCGALIAGFLLILAAVISKR